ncbi:hypothetical protein SDC9_33949 [bioreactor metagenome]|uniref:Uncharacterized protein n=1 Tax=bioreactor metagenome TaxID=1076179 RepID=A0A644V998_9ZZZZ|nr:sulfite exporter TauE/SafE family protein [Methanobrevibacter sp.]MEA4957756.1 sulfite exporter TauE/SafE family protein [Methanobrevibacter sp.]
MEYIILLMIIGIFAGILSGLLGIGGGFLMVPLQYFLLTSMGIDPDLALRISLGTSLAIIIPTAISGAYSHQRESKGLLKIGIILGIFGMFGGILGGITSSHLPFDILGSILGFFLIFTSIFMIFSRNLSKNKNNINSKNSEKFSNNSELENTMLKNENNNYEKLNNSFPIENNDFKKLNNNLECENNQINENNPNPSLKLSIIFGTLVGFSSGLLGIGGGVFLVPILIFLGFSLRKSIALSSIFISLTAIGGTLSYIFSGFGVNNLPYSLGYINLVNFGVIITFSVPMAYLGAKLVYKIPEKRLNQIFAILLIYMGIKMLGLDPISYIFGI